MSRILLCERNEHFKNALFQIIHSRFPEVDIKWFLNSEDCLTETNDYKPHILILGVNIYAGSNELEILERLREKHPDVNILLFTDYEIDEYRKEAIMKGATHIISKETWTGNEILALMKTILASNKLLNDKQAERAIKGDLLKRPLERRRRDLRGRTQEREFLAHNPDRRMKN